MESLPHNPDGSVKETEAPPRVTAPRGRRGTGVYQRGTGKDATWWLAMQHEGKRFYRRLGRRIPRSVAVELADVMRGKILRGEAGIARKWERKDPMFSKAAEAFLARARVHCRPNTVRLYRACIGQLTTAFGGKRLSEIHPFRVEKYKHDRVEAGAPVQMNRELVVLRSIFKACIDREEYAGATAKVKLLKESAGRTRYLEPEEEAALLAAAREPLRTLCVLGIYSGVVSEGLTLLKTDIDLPRRQLTVRKEHAKNGHARTIELNSVLVEALTRHLATAGPSPYVFARDGQRIKSIRKAFMTACRRAGLGPEVTPHVLRHSFASRLTMAGVDPRTIQELGGWRDMAMVQRYSHLSPSHRAAAVEKLVTAAAVVVPLRPAVEGRR